MKKALSIILAMMLVLTFTSCSSKSGTDESTSPRNETKTTAEASQEASQNTTGELPEGAKSLDKFTITYFDFNYNKTSERENKFYDRVKELWYKMYPNSTLNITSAENDGLELLQIQLASGTAADVFEHQTRLAAFAQGGYLMDLSDQPWVDDVYEACLPDCQYDGKVYAAPLACNGWGVYYNKAIFEDKLGLSAPKNFQEFIDICQTIKNAGYDPLIVGGADGWPFQGLFLSFTSFLYGSNENFHIDLYNGEETWTGKAAHDLFDAIKKLYDLRFFSNACISATQSQVLQMMGEGKAVMGFGCPGVLTPLEEEESGYDIDLGYFYIPDWNGYNCVPVIADTVVSVNAAYKYGSTYGADLISCMVNESSMHAYNDNVSPAPFKSISINHNTYSGKAYQAAFDKGPVVLQCTSWLPSSVFDLYQQIVSSILSGNGYSDEMLKDMQNTYLADKKNVNIILN